MWETPNSYEFQNDHNTLNPRLIKFHWPTTLNLEKFDLPKQTVFIIPTFIIYFFFSVLEIVSIVCLLLPSTSRLNSLCHVAYPNRILHWSAYASVLKVIIVQSRAAFDMHIITEWNRCSHPCIRIFPEGSRIISQFQSAVGPFEMIAMWKCVSLVKSHGQVYNKQIMPI